MTNCSKCGAQLGPQAKFCHKCGMMVVKEEPPARASGFFHCKRCSKRVLSRQQFISELASKHSIRVDPQTLNPTISGAFRGWNDAETKKREIQSTYLKVEKDRGFKCNGCGKIYCFDCLFNFAPLHSTTGGKACFSCGDSFSEL